MRISDPALLAEFRGIPCEHCHIRVSTDAAHILACGMGGGGRMDVRIGVVGLCRLCHTMSHNGFSPTLAELLKIVGRREKLAPELVRERLDELRRLPKDSERPVWA